LLPHGVLTAGPALPADPAYKLNQTTDGSLSLFHNNKANSQKTLFVTSAFTRLVRRLSLWEGKFFGPRRFGIKADPWPMRGQKSAGTARGYSKGTIPVPH
jgi:hypothetical protein